MNEVLAPSNLDLDLDREVEQYRRRALIAIQIAFLIGTLCLISFIVGSWPVMVSIAFNGLLSAISIVLAWRSRVTTAALILGAQFLVLPTYLAYIALGTFDSAFLVYPTGMLAISVVGKPRQTAGFAVLTMACASFVAVATLNSWIGNTAFASVVEENPVDIVTTLVIVAFAGIVSTYVSVILTGLLRALADHQSTLEDRVSRRTRELASSNEELRLAIKNLDQARVELVRGEKLAGLGSLVAGVSHELNTPIGNTAVAATTLLYHVNAFRQQLDSGGLRKSDMQIFMNRCTEGAELIVSSSQRAADLVTSFKQVAVDQTSDRRRTFELDEVINDVLRSMRPSLKSHGWKIECEIPAGIQCDGYPGPLGQVITNLVQNAVFHGFRDRASGHVRIASAMGDTEHVQITVRDDGHGISADVLGRIFDPFFTTRLGQGGSGLGLTIVHNLVTTMLNGRIEVESVVGEGTCFTLTMPLVAPQIKHVEVSAA
jgi:signal transduction histidine kinase